TLEARYVPQPEVNVYAANRVGPYDYVVIDAESAQDVNDWLTLNGYRVVPGSEPVVQTYLDEGSKMVAVKLAPGATATSVEPVKLTYPGSDGCMIPIRLTAISARPGLEILTWVFGEVRSVPDSYSSVNLASLTVDAPALYRSVL